MRNLVLTVGDNLQLEVRGETPVQCADKVLGALCFSASLDDLQIKPEIPCLHVPMRRLDRGKSLCEVWHGRGELSQGCEDAIQYRQDADILFGVVTLAESLFEARADKTPLQQVTESAYKRIFSLIETLRYPYLFRFWNYIADINAHSFGLERYRQFNLGRQDAFLAHGREVAGNVPAACALGFAQGSDNDAPLTIAFLAGRVAPISIENPRQISAYQYPEQYGPRSPTFSRASLVRPGDEEVLFISGTASIVGHDTLHPTDVVAQTRETMINIEAVLEQANRQARQVRFDLATLAYKVYIRNAADLERIRAELTRIVGSRPNAVYLQADVCRHDLLLEIEATGGHAVFVSGNAN